MPNYPGPLCGQQAVTSAATALPSLIPGNPLSTGGNAPLASSVRGEGWQVVLGNLKASGNSFFYGNNNNVAATGANAGKEVPAGTTDPPFLVNDLAQIFVVCAAGANGSSTATWSVTPTR